MKLLLDTHLLLWAAGEPDRLSEKAKALIENLENQLYFSPASLWEISIKNSLGREDFKVDISVFRRNLLDNGYLELVITSAHTVTLDKLPALHKDPFDRILVAQTMTEGILLVTADEAISQYDAPLLTV